MRSIIFRYVKEKRGILLSLLLCWTVVLCVFALYRLPLEPFFYALLLSSAVMAAQFSVGFFRYWEKHRIRENINLCIEEIEKGGLKGDTLGEEDYLSIAASLSAQLRSLSNRYSGERQESLDYFTTWVHQIKTPLAVMRMIISGEDTAEHRELSAELFRTEQYVDMVLSYIRLGGGSDFVFAPCSLDGIIRENIRKFAPQFIRKSLKLNYGGCEQTVLTDEKWLGFIIGQLLSNAIKYTPSGSISISVSGDKKLTVSDTGIGIAPEDLPRIFEKGFTGYNGRLDKKSTGLGLYMCKKTADRLGIDISAVSEPGRGTAITLDLAQRKLETE